MITIVLQPFRQGVRDGKLGNYTLDTLEDLNGND